MDVVRLATVGMLGIVAIGTLAAAVIFTVEIVPDDPLTGIAFGIVGGIVIGSLLLGGQDRERTDTTYW